MDAVLLLGVDDSEKVWVNGEKVFEMYGGTAAAGVVGEAGGQPELVGGRGRFALLHRRMGPVARPPRVRPLRHHPKRGGGRGGNRRSVNWRPPIWTGP